MANSNDFGVILPPIIAIYTDPIRILGLSITIYLYKLEFSLIKAESLAAIALIKPQYQE
jgi:hypothetical protein